MKKCYDGDTFLPEIKESDWNKEEHEDFDEFTIYKMTRKQNGNKSN